MRSKKWRRGGVREGGRKNLFSPFYSLPLTLFHFCFPPFPISRHCPLSTVHYAWNRLVHSGPESFFQCRCKGSTDVHFGAFDILKAHTHAATIPASALVKRHFVSIFRFAAQERFLAFCFWRMVFHRRSKRVKIFSETFVIKYLYKRDSNTSKRTCIHERENSQEKRKCSN